MSATSRNETATAQGTNLKVKNDAVTREDYRSPRSDLAQSYIPFGLKELRARGSDPICCGSPKIVAQDETRGADLALPRPRDVRIDRPHREITLSQLLGTPL